jgi:hypothetical protein
MPKIVAIIANFVGLDRSVMYSCVLVVVLGVFNPVFGADRAGRMAFRLFERTIENGSA